MLNRDKFFWSAFSAHTRCTVQATELLTKMLENPADAAELAKQISKLESEGDKITRETVLALHQTWITPLDREEIHGLISRLDDVLDFLEAASERIALYEITDVRPDAIELSKVLEKSVRDVDRAVNLLQSIKDAKPLLDLCEAINKHERDADQIFRRSLARLFKDDSKPLEVMKWRDILEAIETATDRAEDVANIIEGIVLEHA
jgi:predicted phosphate transport protein (TIGR00153 family)